MPEVNIDTVEIMKTLPHRHPFLLVDKIIEHEPKKRAVGIKNVTFDESFFAGHFPGLPVMPGVLIVEALAQVGAWAVLLRPENKGKVAFFAGIDSVRFRKPVVPGDQLRLEVELLKGRANLLKMKGVALVNGSPVCEGELMCSLISPAQQQETSADIDSTAVVHPTAKLGKGLFSPVEEVFPGVHERAFVGKNVKLGKRVLVYPLAYIGDNCEIGDDTIIHPNTTLYPRTRIGKRCIIHSGCVIGVDGFGFVQVGGKFVKVPQIGRVVIEDDVEIYANNCIARGAIGSTVIKRGTKIDNLNHIAHNVVIGRDCAITSQNVFGGSSSVGDRVQMSGQCGVAPHVHVGDDSILMGRAGVTKNSPPKSVLLGYPAQDHAKEHRILALIRKLPELFERIKKLEKEK